MEPSSVLEEINDLIGWPATLKLVKRYGGTHVKIPTLCRDDWDIALLLGRPAALRLHQRFSRTKIYVAKMDEVLRDQRNRAIVDDYSSGVSVSNLARSYGLSDRQIWNILSSP